MDAKEAFTLQIRESNVDPFIGSLGSHQLYVPFGAKAECFRIVYSDNGSARLEE